MRHHVSLIDGLAETSQSFTDGASALVYFFSLADGEEIDRKLVNQQRNGCLDWLIRGMPSAWDIRTALYAAAAGQLVSFGVSLPVGGLRLEAYD